MTKKERHQHNEKCLRDYQIRNGKTEDELPFLGDAPPYSGIFPPEADKYRQPETVGFYNCVVRHEPAGEDKFWCSEQICYWDGTGWTRDDGGPLRYGIEKFLDLIQ